MSILRSPVARLSGGLALLTVTILLLGDAIGLVPDPRASELESRKIIVESLAVQLSSEVATIDVGKLRQVLRAVVERNDDVLSAGVRRRGGALIAEAGVHDELWTLSAGERSTPTQVRVPLFRNSARWGTVEIRFGDLGRDDRFGSLGGSFATIILFVALLGFLSYLLFLRRALRELDPSAVIPERVRGALDTLTEGLLVIDARERVVFANSSFAHVTGMAPETLMGKRASELGWRLAGGGAGQGPPWADVLERAERVTGAQLSFETALHDVRTFTVNASPIAGPTGNVRGVLVTFDDITALELKNEELGRLLGQLEASQREITRQNQELQVLATRDPLTGSLNRRSLFDGLGTLFEEARAERQELSCIMVDIDHFKSINDRFGHATGDKVIKLLARLLSESTRPTDLVGRYGGEEFCVVLPDTPLEAASETAEQMRAKLTQERHGEYATALRITSSFGVAELTVGCAGSPNELVDQADKALYAAKERGRNRVVGWSQDLAAGPAGTNQKDEAHAPPAGSGDDESRRDARQPGDSAPADVSADEQRRALQARVRALEEALSDSERGRLDGHALEGVAGLPNRVLLLDRVGQAIERARRFEGQLAILALQLDPVHRINSTLGHRAGEKFIAAAASRLNQALRKTDTVALGTNAPRSFTVSRSDTDELMVVLNDLREIESVTGIVERIFDDLESPVLIESSEVLMTSSIGVSTYPHDGADAPTLVSRASAAMREAKQSLGSRICRFYSEDIDRRLKKQMRLEGELHRAVEHGELVVHYQPKVEVGSGRMTGLEALVRWNHPRLGLLSPGDFIAVAERSGVIERVGEWVIDAVCRQVKAWLDAGLDPVPVAVNVSPVQFRRDDFAERVVAMVDNVGVDRALLEIEITETVVMQNMDSAVRIIEALNSAGISATLDDFGTGYSSLTCLSRFPLRKLKIDRSFIADFTENPGDSAIVSGIIAMAHSMGLRVVAEGVETMEQLGFLEDLQCDEAQGFLVGEPLPREEVGKLLRDGVASVRGRNGNGNVVRFAPEMIGLLNTAS